MTDLEELSLQHGILSTKYEELRAKYEDAIGELAALREETS